MKSTARAIAHHASTLRRLLFRGLLLAALGLGHGLSAAQVWTNPICPTCSACISCHGAPPDTGNSSGSGSFVLGLAEGWLSSAATLRTRVNAAGATQMVEAMQRVGDTEAAELLAYFTNLRDGVVGTAAPVFADTPVGATDTRTFSFSVSNYRNVAMGYTLSIAGTHAADFSVQSHNVTGAGCTVGSAGAATSINPRVCQVNLIVAFTPAAAGNPRSASLRVNLSAATNPAPQSLPRQVAALSGVAFVPTPVYAGSASTLAFTARVGQTAAQSLTVCNGSFAGGACSAGAASATLNLSGLTFSRSEYSRDAASTCATGASLAPGGSCRLDVVFTPGSAGPANGAVQIAHNAAGGSATVNLNGTATQALIGGAPSPLAFGDVQIGFSRALTLTVSNAGTAPLSFTGDPRAAARLSGVNSADFAITGGSCQLGVTVPSSGNCTLAISFAPSAGANVARAATLTLPSDATNGPLVVSLGGGAVALPPPEFSATSLSFPDTVVGEAGPTLREFTITNRRSNAITYVVGGTADFAVVEDAGACAGRVVRANGGVCTVRLRFTPQTAAGPGLRSANLPVTFVVGSGEPPASPGNIALSGTAVLPLALSATALSPSAVVGSPVTSSLVINNRSQASVTLSSLAFGGAAAADYALDASATCTAGGALASGGNCTLVLRFNPAAAGARAAVLTIAHSAFGSPQTVSLNGTATPAPQGRVELSALSLAFADTQLNGSARQSVTVRNAGDLALRLNALAVSGTHAAEFERAGSCSTATPLGIGEQCTIDITFLPAAVGARSAALSITHDGSNPSATLALSGVGAPVPAPVVSFDAASLSFGAQTVGGLYPARTLRLTNAGTAVLALASVAVEGAAFSLLNPTPCPASLAPGEGCNIAVRFLPSAAGSSNTGAVRVASNAAGSTHGVPLSGSGTLAAVPVLVWAPALTRLDFGQVSAGTVSPVQSATVRNQGPGGATMALINAVGADAAVFAVGSDSGDPADTAACRTGQVLFEGDSCRVDVRFAPGVGGARSAVVQVASDGAAPPALALVGIGLGGPTPALRLSSGSLSMPDTRVGAASLPAELLIQSSGAGTLRVMSLAVSGPFVLDNKSCPAAPFTLPAGASCAVALAFVPTAAGAASGALEIGTDASPASQTVALSARADPAPDVSSGSGCSIASGTPATDPTLWALALLAVLALVFRRRAHPSARPSHGHGDRQ